MLRGRMKYRQTITAISAWNTNPLLVVVLLGVIAMSSTMTVPVLASQAVQRPISDFLSMQGTTMVFNTPVPDQIGWVNNPPTLFALFDYAGLAAKYLQDNFGILLDTTTSGSITERPLPDGRAESTVILHTKRALTWAAGPAPDPNVTPPSFGYRPAEIAADPSKVPALGESHLHVVFKNPAPGADLPDLVDAFILGNAAPGQELVFLAFRGTATGPLRAPSGLGPEGTPGRCFVVQTGILFRGPFKGATADGFPAELVELRRIGH